MASVAELASSREYERLNFEKHIVPISRSIALEVYSNTKPCNLKISNLQKGLVLVYDGVERVGEGTGFGFPVLIYPKETYFSGSAEVWIKQTRGCTKIRKEFTMDRIARNKLGNIHLENKQARAFIRVLTDFYQKNRRFRYLALKELVVNTGVKATFVKTVPVGKVPVTYKITGYNIEVKVDFRLLKRRPERIFLLNKQSANFFPRYTDSEGPNLVGKQIGAWDTVKAESACLTDLRGQIGFRLWNMDGCLLRRGRETMKNCLDWSGLDYEVDPKKQVLQYRIEIFGGD